MLRKLFMAIVIIAASIILVGCDDYPVTTTNGTSADKETTKQVANKLQSAQPTPSDIDYSLERFRRRCGRIRRLVVTTITS